MYCMMSHQDLVFHGGYGFKWAERNAIMLQLLNRNTNITSLTYSESSQEGKLSV